MPQTSQVSAQLLVMRPFVFSGGDYAGAGVSARAFPARHFSLSREPIQLLLIAMREMILLMPAVLAVASAMAWWTLRRGGPSARRWAIAASISSLVMSAPFLVADVAIGSIL